jgi:hypothetical protein
VADFNALKNDVVKALGHLPKTVVDVLLTTAETVIHKERDALEAAFPKILELLKPHASAVMFEMATGVLDKDELENALMDAIKAAGNGAHGG